MEQLDLFAAMANEDQERNEYLELVKKLNHFAELYYAQDEPEISDYEYDTMNNRLKALEKDQYHDNSSRLHRRPDDPRRSSEKG